MRSFISDPVPGYFCSDNLGYCRRAPFPNLAALFINFLGILIDLAVPYWIGYFSGTDAINKLIVKYPKFESILGLQKSNSLFLCFFLRMIGGLPADIVTMYFGAAGTGFWLSFSLILLLSAGSSVAYYLYRRKLQDKQAAYMIQKKEEDQT